MPIPTEQQDRYTPTSWGGGGEDLRMPSGQLALVKKVDPGQLLDQIHSMDSLTPIVNGLLAKAEGRPTKVDTSKILKNPEQVSQLLHVVDRVVTAAVVKPTVKMTPNDVTNREPGVIYCDDIALTDRMYIFAYAISEVRDAEQFRLESAESLGGLADLAENARTTK